MTLAVDLMLILAVFLLLTRGCLSSFGKLSLSLAYPFATFFLYVLFPHWPTLLFIMTLTLLMLGCLDGRNRLTFVMTGMGAPVAYALALTSLVFEMKARFPSALDAIVSYLGQRYIEGHHCATFCGNYTEATQALGQCWSPVIVFALVAAGVFFLAEKLAAKMFASCKP